MTEAKIKKVLKEHTFIIVDTREKKNQHITECLDKYGIRWKSKKLDYGDYGLEIEPCELVPEGYVAKLVVERKGSLNEILINLTREKDRFQREFDRCKADECDMIIVIETENGSYSDLVRGDFRNKLTVKQAMGLIHSMYAKNRIPFEFVSKQFSALFIYSFLKYEAKRFLKLIK